MVESTIPNVQRNRLLDAMSNADLAKLQPHLEHTQLAFRQRLQPVNQKIKSCYFPESGIASKSRLRAAKG
jgi:hypothetical protein